MYLGIDAGMSKVAGLIIDKNGKKIAEHLTEGMDHMGELYPEAQTAFHSIVTELCTQAGIANEDIIHCGIGACGIDFDEQIPEAENILSQILFIPQDRITVVNDSIVALWSSSDLPESLILQHGSAFTSAIRTSWDNAKIFDSADIGSIFDMRYHLLCKVARMIDGRLAETDIKKKLLDFFEITDESVFGPCIDHGIVPYDRQYHTVPLIFEALNEGDLTARSLVNEAIEDYALMVKIMIKKSGCTSPAVVFSGGLLDRTPDDFIKACEKKVSELGYDISITRPLLKPVFGAVIMAASFAEDNLPAFIKRILKMQ